MNALLRLPVLVLIAVSLAGCLSEESPYLDPSIPSVGTPSTDIAFVRTKWIQGKLLETTFLDKQNRVLEEFVYGRINSKKLNQYVGNQLRSSIYYYHSDSSPRGYVGVTESHFTYNRTGRLGHTRTILYTLESGERIYTNKPTTVTYTYVGLHDTLVHYALASNPDTSASLNSVRWEHDRQGRVIRNFRLNTSRRPSDARSDTLNYYSRRFLYDKLGRRTMSWYDLMYLGPFYSAHPDTIKYYYDRQNRLVREVHRYTTNMRNKREIDTVKLDKFSRQSIAWHRRKFFVGDSIFHNNNKIVIINYHYEPFDPAKHLPLHVSQDVDYQF